MKTNLTNYKETDKFIEFTMCNPLSNTCQCPIVTINKVTKEVFIIDDYKNSIKMTIDQFNSLKNYFN